MEEQKRTKGLRFPITESDQMLGNLFYIVVFPGFLFLGFFGLIAEFVDRKMYARLQNRVGPPWFQPFADFIKLIAKEDIVPENANLKLFKNLPVIALTATLTAFMYIPLWGQKAVFSFNGDIIVIFYLLTIPAVTFFLAGWYSMSHYSMIGAVRSLTQFFAYEIPLSIGILSPAILANSWCLADIIKFYNGHPFYAAFNLLGFCVSLIALNGKLEKAPFDIPEAETEIVAGTFTEFTGRLLAIFRLATDIELIVGASLLSAVFLPFGQDAAPLYGFLFYLVKVFSIVFLLSLFRTIFARLRIDQMVNFCWKYVAPLSFLQLFINMIIGGMILK